MLKSIIDALAHGRLVELPGNDKGDALQFLATMLEAVPSIPPGTDIVEVVLEHEKVSNTSLGGGWACPHARVRFDGELSCAIGWSPAGIDYGVPGEPPVHMIVMYLVPDNQRNAYLKEVSSLARVLQNNPRYLTIEAFTSLDTSRNNLLDIAHLAMNGDGKNPRARMIQLATQSKAAAPEGVEFAGAEIDALLIVTAPEMSPVVLTQNQELATLAGSDSGLVAAIAAGNRYQMKDWQVVRRSSTAYFGDRFIHDCIAVKPRTGRP
jgi:mannitol/fructose-specific phosphotransferase system IIA component (Ntr-type)